MTEHWQESKAWSDRFIPHAQQLLGLTCIGVAAIDQDRKENTDLMFEVGWQRIAVRIRRLEQRLAFNRRNEITLRFDRRSGAETELAKLMNGWGDCFLYGWGDEASGQIRAYTLLDLHQLRGWLFQYLLTYQRLPSPVMPDRDGSASFLPLCLDCMPGEILRRRVTLLPSDPPITDLHWRQSHAPAA